MSISRLMARSLCVLFLGLAAGAVFVGAQANIVKVSAYVATVPTDPAGVPISPVTSAVVSTTVTPANAGKGQDVLKAANDAVNAVAKLAPKPSNQRTSVLVKLTNADPLNVIELREYPLGKLQQLFNDKPAHFAFSLEIPDVPVKEEMQVFDPPLLIQLTFPRGSRPFILSQDKTDVFFFENGEINLPGLMKGQFTMGDNGLSATIRVDAWLPGDPCCGG